MERPRRAPTLAALLALGLLAGPAAGQALRDGEPDPLGPGSAAARSLLVPGWGQWSRGQRRSLAYAAAEAALWAFWAHRRDQGSDLRSGYRDLAWRTGRLAAGERRDGSWDYYETLSKWTRSGSFDRDPTRPGIQPEEDPTSFNGSVWSLARGIHFGGGSPGPGEPAYEAAVAWYGKRAYGDGFLWDWSGREGDLAEYRGLIERSDDRFRDATAALGAVLANHLLSAADAFVSARVPGDAELRLLHPGDATAPPLWLTFSWRPPT